MKTYRLKKEIELKGSLPLGSLIELGDVCLLDDDGTIPTEWLVEHGYLEEEKDIYERCAKKIKDYTERGGDVWQCKVEEILKQHFPQPTETVIDMEEHKKRLEEKSKTPGWINGLHTMSLDFLKHKGFKIINE